MILLGRGRARVLIAHVVLKDLHKKVDFSRTEEVPPPGKVDHFGSSLSSRLVFAPENAHRRPPLIQSLPKLHLEVRIQKVLLALEGDRHMWGLKRLGDLEGLDDLVLPLGLESERPWLPTLPEVGDDLVVRGALPRQLVLLQRCIEVGVKDVRYARRRVLVVLVHAFLNQRVDQHLLARTGRVIDFEHR